MSDLTIEPGWLRNVLDDASLQVDATAAGQVAVASKKPILREALRTFINTVHDTEPEAFVDAQRQWGKRV